MKSLINLCFVVVLSGSIALSQTVSPPPGGGGGGSGDIEGVTAGNGISGGGTSGTVTVTNAAPIYGCTDTGGDDAYVCSPSGFPVAYATGQSLLITFTTQNTGAATIDAGPGAKPVKLPGGSTDPSTGDIVALKPMIVRYDSTGDGGSGAWILAVTSGGGGGGSFQTLTGIFTPSATTTVLTVTGGTASGGNVPFVISTTGTVELGASSCTTGGQVWVYLNIATGTRYVDTNANVTQANVTVSNITKGSAVATGFPAGSIPIAHAPCGATLDEFGTLVDDRGLTGFKVNAGSGITASAQSDGSVTIAATGGTNSCGVSAGNGWFGSFPFGNGFSTHAATGNGVNTSANRVMAYQMVVPCTLEMNRVVFNVTAACGGACGLRIVIWNAAKDTRVVDTGALTTEPSGTGIKKVTVSDTTLSPGTYWMSWTSDDTTLTMASINGSGSYDFSQPGFVLAGIGTSARGGQGATSSTGTGGSIDFGATLGTINGSNDWNRPLFFYLTKE